MRTLKNRFGFLLIGLLGVTALGASTCLCEQSFYRTPPEGVVRIVDAPPPPLNIISPTADAMLLVESESMPPLSLVARLKEPFSYRVPYFWFARTTEIWDRQGKIVRNVADLPVSDDVPPQGVETGPRYLQWQPLLPARVLWVQALDDGDPIKKVPHRDAVWRMEAADNDPAKEVIRIEHRLTGIEWLPTPD
jgi:hypothetical protein